MARHSRFVSSVIGSGVAVASVITFGARVGVAEGSDTTIPSGGTSTVPTTVAPNPVPTTVAPGPQRPTKPTVTTPTATKPKRVRIGSVRVVLDEQKAYVYGRTGRLITSMPVSTGLWDSTPTGSFRVFSKSANTFYTPSPKEKMRWMTRFTKGRNGGNIGFHGIPYVVTKAGEKPFPTPLGKAPSSHGCVRMRNSDARWIFDNLDIGAKVVVVRTRR